MSHPAIEFSWDCYVHYVPEEADLFPGWEGAPTLECMAINPESAAKWLVWNLAHEGTIHSGAQVCVRVKGHEGDQLFDVQADREWTIKTTKR